MAESAEKERAESSSGSLEGRTGSGEGELVGGKSSRIRSRLLVDGGGGRRATFLFFEEDVLAVSCPGSSGTENFLQLVVPLVVRRVAGGEVVMDLVGSGRRRDEKVERLI